MVVFIDLDDEAEPPELSFNGPEAPKHWFQTDHANSIARTHTLQGSEEMLKERINPNKNAVTEALGCYPSVPAAKLHTQTLTSASRIISEIASMIDLNTLDNLSRTCRQTRENLLQFRKQLIDRTLR